MTSEFADFVALLLSQFAGGPGPSENNLVRFGLGTAFFGILLAIVWSKNHQQKTLREQWLVWGFGFGFTREAYMLARTAIRIITETEHDIMCSYSEPLEHAMGLTALVVIAGAFIRYLLDDPKLSRRYLQVGLGITGVAFPVTFWWWSKHLRAHPEVHYHETWAAWPFHVAGVLLLAAAIVFMIRHKGWLRNVVALALGFFMFSEAMILLNYATERMYRFYICPVGNSLHILAIPLLGYVYLREQSIARQRAEDELDAYRHHLEDLVARRTAELTATNNQMQRAIVERVQVEVALEQLARQNELILESAGEGIFGVDVDGRHTFVNPAAARMLDFEARDLIGKPSHATWHHSRPDGSAYPVDECPLHHGYRSGKVVQGEDQWFWRQDGSCFPVEYTSTGVWEGGELTGAVVVFRDISERKQAEREIAQRSAELAGQNAIADTISQSLDLDTILHTALEKVLEILEMQAGRIFLLDPDGKTMTLQAQAGNGFDAGAVPAGLRLPLTEGISGMAMVDSLPVVLSASDLENAHPADFGGFDDKALSSLETFISTPLVSKGWVIGALTLGAEGAEMISAQVLSLLASIGQQIGIAVENAHLYRQTERWAGAMAQLHRASLLISSSLDMTTIYDQITEQGAKLLNCDMANLFLWDQEAGESVGFSSFGTEGDGVKGLRLTPQDGSILAELVAYRRPIAIKNYATDAQAIPALGEMFDIQAELALPLQVHERLLGFLFIIDQSGPRVWRAEEIDWAESLVSHASIALENALLYDKAERAAALEERQRIAAEIHDGLAQTLGYLGLQADQVIELVSAGNQDESVQELHQIRKVIGQASSEVRKSIASLQEGSQSLRPLQEWLDDIAAEFTQENNPAIEFDSGIKAPLLMAPADLEQVLRVVQEAVLNVLRHANANRIVLHLEEQGANGVVTITDDGEGFDPDAPAPDSRMRFGLSIMSARAARLRGRVRVSTEPGKGTQVSLIWPLSGTIFSKSMPG